MIRPEHLEVAAGGPRRTACSAAGDRALISCFQGPVLRVALRDPTGGELVDYSIRSRQRDGVTPGASLWASWKPGAARLLQPDD
jgi:hypothetical protein